MTSFASSSRWLLVVLLALPLLLAREPRGYADPAREFRQHYESALRLYDNGQYEGAIKEFQAAYTLKQLPRLLLNIGQAHRKLGHARDALGFYEFYLRVEPNPKPEIKAELTTYIVQTRALLDAAEHMRATQEPPPPSTPPQGASPGQDVSPAPSAPPQQPDRPAASASATAAPAPQAPSTPPTAAQPALVALPAASARRAEPESSRPVYKKWWFWTLIGVGVAGAATGIALGVRAATAPSDPANIEIRNVF